MGVEYFLSVLLPNPLPSTPVFPFKFLELNWDPIFCSRTYSGRQMCSGGLLWATKFRMAKFELSYLKKTSRLCWRMLCIAITFDCMRVRVYDFYQEIGWTRPFERSCWGSFRPTPELKKSPFNSTNTQSIHPSNQANRPSKCCVSPSWRKDHLNSRRRQGRFVRAPTRGCQTLQKGLAMGSLDVLFFLAVRPNERLEGFKYVQHRLWGPTKVPCYFSLIRIFFAALW